MRPFQKSRALFARQVSRPRPGRRAGHPASAAARHPRGRRRTAGSPRGSGVARGRARPRSLPSGRRAAPPLPSGRGRAAAEGARPRGPRAALSPLPSPLCPPGAAAPPCPVRPEGRAVGATTGARPDRAALADLGARSARPRPEGKGKRRPCHGQGAKQTGRRIALRPVGMLRIVPRWSSARTALPAPTALPFHGRRQAGYATPNQQSRLALAYPPA